MVPFEFGRRHRHGDNRPREDCEPAVPCPVVGCRVAGLARA
jgi:hypothetical protein